MDFRELEDRISSDFGELTEFDREAVRTVAVLLDQFRQATELVEEDGLFDDEGKRHSAVKTQMDMSSEITRWVKERPDLFGKREHEEKKPAAPKLARFKAV